MTFVEINYFGIGLYTYCVLKVNAALVMLDGRCSPLMISCHSFLLMTSTSPPRAITKLYSSYRSNTDLAMIGRRLIGVPERRKQFFRTFLEHQLLDAALTNFIKIRFFLQLFEIDNDASRVNQEGKCFNFHLNSTSHNFKMWKKMSHGETDMLIIASENCLKTSFKL